MILPPRHHFQPLLQLRPRAGEQHLGVGGGDAERLGDFRVGVVLHRVEVEDGALFDGQLPDGLQQFLLREPDLREFRIVGELGRRGW